MRNLLAMAEGKGIFDALVGVGNSAGGWEGDLFGIDPLYMIELCILHSLFDVILFAIRYLPQKGQHARSGAPNWPHLFRRAPRPRSDGVLQPVDHLLEG